MGRTYSLSSDKIVVIFTTPAAKALFEELGNKTNLQRQFLSRLHDALTSETPQAFVEKPFQGVTSLQQFRAGDVMRGYCVYADEPPEYNIFYMFQVTDHQYSRNPVMKYDSDAGEVLQELRDLETVEETEAYLEDHDAHDAEAVELMLEQL